MGWAQVLDENNQPVMTREYTFTRPDGSKVVIQDHGAGHKFKNKDGTEDPNGQQGPHFNVRPEDRPRGGDVPGTKEHYPFKGGEKKEEK